jgi:hypothetical protein
VYGSCCGKIALDMPSIATRLALAVLALVACAASEMPPGHMDRFGKHMPARSRVMEVNATELRMRSRNGERTLLDPGVFLDTLVVHHVPVVFKELAKNWDARQKVLSDDWMIETLGKRPIRVETKDDNKHDIPPNRPFSDFFKEHKQGDNLYMVDETPPVLHRYFPLPEPLRCPLISSKFFVTYFWMSTGETDSKMHIDTDENLMCVLSGTKHVLLVDPKYGKELYADDSYAIGVSPIETRHVNFTQHPLTATVPYDLAVVEAGDCFFLPQNYWHYVYSFGKRNQALTMWWKSRPIVTPSKFTFTLDHLSFAESLENYEAYVQAVANDTRSVKDVCWEAAKEQASAFGLGEGDEGAWRYLNEPEALKMANFEFATDKEGGFEHGEDSKGDRDEVDWENPQQAEMGLPEPFSHCHFNLTNMKNPCFVPGCLSRDDSYGCVRYSLEYCKRFPDYGCQDLVWILNKKSKEEYAIITRELPNVYEMYVEDWPSMARSVEDDEKLMANDAEDEEFEDEMLDEVQDLVLGVDGEEEVPVAAEQPRQRYSANSIGLGPLEKVIAKHDQRDYRMLLAWMASHRRLREGPMTRVAERMVSDPLFSDVQVLQDLINEMDEVYRAKDRSQGIRRRAHTDLLE